MGFFRAPSHGPIMIGTKAAGGLRHQGIKWNPHPHQRVDAKSRPGIRIQQWTLRSLYQLPLYFSPILTLCSGIHIAYRSPDPDFLFHQQLRCMSNSNAFMASRGSLDALQPVQLNQLHDAPRPPLKKRKLSVSSEWAADDIVIRVRCQPTQHPYPQMY